VRICAHMHVLVHFTFSRSRKRRELDIFSIERVDMLTIEHISTGENGELFGNFHIFTVVPNGLKVM